MGRHAEGWRLRQRAPGYAWAVRFTIEGCGEIERSTGTSDPKQASREAARIYAEEVRRPRGKRTLARSRELATLIKDWLFNLRATHDPETIKTWTTYANHFQDHFGDSRHLNEGNSDAYMRARLLKVQAGSVRKELTALRSFFKFAKVDAGVPKVPRRATGTPHPQKRRSAAVDLSPAEVERLISELPEWSTSKRVKAFPIRARFIVAYQTGLRPATLDALSCPEHYQKGQPYIRITAELDKNRWARQIPLTDEARAALDAVCSEEGLIFGAHDYREHWRAAAKQALPKDRAGRFTGAHFRSARITHLLELSGNLPGVQYLVGHKHATTTNKYSRPSERAAEAVLRLSLKDGKEKEIGGPD